MSDESPRLLLPFILPAQAQKHVTHNEALERLDLVTQLTVEAFDATEPPDLPEAGRIWALGQGAGGAWAGHDGALAAWTGNDWQFITPAPGWRAAQGGDLRLWTGAGWESPTPGDLDDLPGLGVNTGFDGTNRLSVAAPATLLTHEGAGHQLKINKASTGDTASLLFQTGWSGRAEMGTPGEDDFAIKVSPDGSAWNEAVRFAGASGKACFPNGAEIEGALSGSAVTQSFTDTTVGRLLKTRDAGILNSSMGSEEPDDVSTNRIFRSDGVTARPFVSAGSFAGWSLVRNDGVRRAQLGLLLPGSYRPRAGIRVYYDTDTWSD